MRKECVMAYFKILSWHLAGGSTEYHKTPVITAGLWAEIWTQHIPTMKQECYPWGHSFNLLSRIKRRPCISAARTYTDIQKCICYGCPVVSGVSLGSYRHIWSEISPCEYKESVYTKNTAHFGVASATHARCTVPTLWSGWTFESVTSASQCLSVYWCFHSVVSYLYWYQEYPKGSESVIQQAFQAISWTFLA